MTTRAHTLALGVYKESIQVQQTFKQLHDAGFSDQQIAVDGPSTGAQGVLDALLSLGLPEAEAHQYAQALQEGNYVIVVNANGREQEAARILQRTGADLLQPHPEQVIETEGERVIPIREERFDIQKQWVPHGEVRIHRRVIIEEKTITVQVAREEVEIEHISYQDQSTPPTTQNSPQGHVVSLKAGEIMRIPVREEYVFVEKRPIIKEEIIVGKQLLQGVQHLSDTLLREVPVVEKSGQVTVTEHTSDERR